MIAEGNEVIVTCEATGYPQPIIVLSRSDAALSDRVSVSDSVSFPTEYGNVTRVSVNLTITNATREDTGMYICSANNTVGSNDEIVNITVQCKYSVALLNRFVMHCLFCFAVIPIILSDITDLSDEGRDMVNFTCIAIGEPTPDISWYFNDIMINAPYDSIKYMIVSEPFNITTTASMLILHNATASDVGVYTCTASNTLGNDTSHGKETLY